MNMAMNIDHSCVKWDHRPMGKDDFYFLIEF